MDAWVDWIVFPPKDWNNEKVKIPNLVLLQPGGIHNAINCCMISSEPGLTDAER
jgi:hypothetical protein